MRAFDLTVTGSIFISGSTKFQEDATIDAAANINLDADGAVIKLKDGGTEFGRLSRVSSDLVIKSAGNNNDILFKGVDGGGTITALTLDMSEGGRAIFLSDVSGSSTSTGSFGEVNVAELSIPSVKTLSSSIATGIASNLANFRSDTTISGSTTSLSSSIASDVAANLVSITNNSSSVASDVASNLSTINTLKGSGTTQGVGQGNSPTFAAGTITGNFNVGGTLTAQEVHTEFESASILFTSGSTLFGNSSDDVHEFKGNKISGSSTSTASLAMISLADKIEHIGDTNNTIEFGTDEIKLRTGGSSRLIARDANVELYNNLIVAGAVTSSLLLVDGVSNYKGIEIKGSGASRPQLKFTNVNQGTLGQIYGTEGNDLSIVAADDLILDATGEHIYLDDGGTNIGNIDMGSQNLTFRASVDDKDIIFRGQDGSSEIEAMRIDFSAAGAVGIGTASPGGVLDIWSGSSRLFQVQTDGVGVGNNNPGTYGVLHVTGVGDTSITGSTFYDGYGEINLSGNPVGPHTLALSSTAEASTDVGIQNMGPSIVFRGQPGTGLDGGATFAAIAGTFDASNSNYEAKGNLRFFTSAGYQFSPNYGTELKERMKITNSGEIHLGYSGGGYVYLYEVNDNSNYYLMYTHTDTTFRLNHNGSGNDELELQTDGDLVIQGTLTESSDVRLKENIETIQDALSKVNQMRGVSYNKIGEEKVRIGMVADEVEKIIPELVSIGGERGKFDEDGFDNVKSLKYTNMVGVLVEAVKELTEKNNALEKRIEDLEK